MCLSEQNQLICHSGWGWDMHQDICTAVFQKSVYLIEKIEVCIILVNRITRKVSYLVFNNIISCQVLPVSISNHICSGSIFKWHFSILNSNLNTMIHVSCTTFSAGTPFTFGFSQNNKRKCLITMSFKNQNLHKQRYCEPFTVEI